MPVNLVLCLLAAEAVVFNSFHLSDYGHLFQGNIRCVYSAVSSKRLPAVLAKRLYFVSASEEGSDWMKNGVQLLISARLHRRDKWGYSSFLFHSLGEQHLGVISSGNTQCAVVLFESIWILCAEHWAERRANLCVVCLKLLTSEPFLHACVLFRLNHLFALCLPSF